MAIESNGLPPTVLVISDSLGDTACEVVLAAAGQFEEGSIRIARLPKVERVQQVVDYLAPRIEEGERIAVFHTIVTEDLRAEVVDALLDLRVPAVDLMGPAMYILSYLTGCHPSGIPGTIHRTDDAYFRRIDAMEYFVEHDDGRGADDLSHADIVLLGVSRTSKTPLSMYLAFHGYKVANIPLAHGMEPPASLYDVDPMRLFGLLSTTDVIADIRDRRLGDDMARAVAGSYADPVAIEREMDEARALMKHLGCFIIRTDKKAVEEAGAEIIAHLEEMRALRDARRARS